MSTATSIPKQLVILSGKGGTGKTTVAAALGALANNKVLADCDVDAANLHLVLDPTLVRRERFVSGKEARIAPERCTACGLCSEHCRFGAIVPGRNGRSDSVPVVDLLACEGCGLCARVCSFDAVEMFDVERGEWFVSDTRHGPLVHAQLAIGGENSGKLVTLVRNEAQALAATFGAGLVIVDGPPGIGCPVIASATGADLVLAVTEPSVSGEHDLERIGELVTGFGLPLAVCINKHDLNQAIAQRMRDACEARGYRVVGELVYDIAAIRAQVEGKSVVENGDSVIATQIREMWLSLEDMLKEAEVHR